MKLVCFFPLLSLLISAPLVQATERKPNIIIVFCDDLGYADIGPFGATKHATPVLDQMSREGMRLTDFYSTCPVCTPSRASLMTGCYPRRVNMHVDEKNLCVLFPAARKGLNPREVTIAEVLKEQGYATMCIGKWHLGDHPDFMPTSHGFDHYFGIPYSNDMNRKEVPLPLVRDLEVIEDSVQKDTTITARYTTEAVRFIRENSKKPFFLYLPHTAVHLPLVPGKKFKGSSKGGAYGDWVQEIDWSMGELFKALKTEGIDENTLVLFTSDNGGHPEYTANGPLRGSKWNLYEGGIRVPLIVRWPDQITPGKTTDMPIVGYDLHPSFADLAGIKTAGLDGVSVLSNLQDTSSLEERPLYWHFPYYHPETGFAKAPDGIGVNDFVTSRTRPQSAIRRGRYKLIHFYEDNHDELYDLTQDLSEQTDLLAEKPQIAAELSASLQDYLAEVDARLPRKH